MGENETLKRQLVQADIKGATNEVETQMKDELVKSKAQQKLMRQRMADKDQAMKVK